MFRRLGLVCLGAALGLGCGNGGGDGKAGVATGNASVSGLVLDQAESPLGGVKVSAGGVDTTTDEDGAFTLAHLNAQAASVLELDGSALTGDDGRAHFAHARRALTLSDSDALTLDEPIFLPALNPVDSAVDALDFVAGDPQVAVARTDIALYPPGTDGVALNIPAGTKITWPAGSTPGTLSVTPLPLAHVPFAVEGGAGLALQIEPEGIRFEAGPALADGTPAALPTFGISNDLGLDDGTALTVSRYSPSTGQLEPVGTASVATDAEGASTLTMTAADATIQAQSLRPQAGSGAGERPGGCSGVCVLTCDPRTYTGTVLDTLNRPVAGADVNLFEGAVNALRGRVVATTTTDDDGHYRLPKSTLCRWQIEVDADDGQHAVQVGNVAAGSLDVSVPDMTLQAYSAPSNIEVAVIDPAGLPWAGLEIVAMQPGAPSTAFASATTDKKGIARLRGVRTPLEPSAVRNSRERSALLVVGETKTNCLPPAEVNVLPPSPAGKPVPTLGLSAKWVADQKVTLTSIAGDANALGLMTLVPRSVNSGLTARDNHERRLTVTVRAAQISARATLALMTDTVRPLSPLPVVVGGGALSCHSVATAKTPLVFVESRFAVPITVSAPESLDDDREVSDIWLDVRDPDAKHALRRDIRVAAEDQVGSAFKLSQTSFTALTPVRLTTDPPLTHKVLYNDDGSLCVVSSGTSSFFAVSFDAAQTGTLHIASADNGCENIVDEAYSRSPPIAYSVVNPKPTLDRVSPTIVTETMRREGFDLTLTGSGISSGGNELSQLSVGDRDPTLPAPAAAPDTKPASALPISVSLAGDERSALKGDVRVRIPAGQLPDALATREGDGHRQRVCVLLPPPGGGIACSELHFTADTLCAKNNGGCDRNALCSDYGTSVQCACNDGYIGDGKHCADVDECQTINGGCDANATCKNTAGSRTCKCNSGFTGDGLACADIDECASGKNDCDANATCHNSSGSFGCECNAGYFGDGQSCTNDPCAKDNGGCGPTLICHHDAQGLTCDCLPGQVHDGAFGCAVDPCLTSNGGCNPTQTCVAASGTTVKCVCDVDEVNDGAGGCYKDPCATNNGGCGANFTCYPFPPPAPPGCECDAPNLFDPDKNTCTAP